MVLQATISSVYIHFYMIVFVQVMLATLKSRNLSFFTTVVCIRVYGSSLLFLLDLGKCVLQQPQPNPLSEIVFCFMKCIFTVLNLKCQTLDTKKNKAT